MKQRSLLSALTVALTIAVTARAEPAAPSAHEIMLKSEEATRFASLTASATISTVAGDSTRTKTFSWWRKLEDNKVHFHTLMRFLAPAEVRGEGILIAEHDGANDVQVYLPTFKKIRRVEGQSQSASFMGTTFSYSDMSVIHAAEYNATLLRTEACPHDAQVRCFVIEATPTTDTVRDRTGYSKQVQWIRVDNSIVVQSDMFDLAGQPAKHLTATQIREVDPAAHKWLAHEVRLEDLKTKKYTLLQFASVKANTQIEDAIFSAQNLAHE